MVWPAIAAAGIAAAGSIGGGLLSRPDLSSRDLAYVGHDIWRKQARERYPLQVESLKTAGLNPIMAVAQPPPATSTPMPPQPYTDPVGAGIGNAAKSATSAFMAMHQARQIEADTEFKEAQATSAKADARLKDEQARTEPEKRWELQSKAGMQHSAAALSREQTRIAEISKLVREQDLSVRQKDAIIAAIDAELMEGGIGDISRVLQAFNMKPGDAANLARLIFRIFRGGRN